MAVSRAAAMTGFRGREPMRVRVLRAWPGVHRDQVIELPAFRAEVLSRGGFAAFEPSTEPKRRRPRKTGD